MRILHTSDWHLGQNFMNHSREREHAVLIDWVLEQVEAHAVDAVLIAGDIFDTGTPPSYARALYYRLIAQLHQRKVALLLLGGNHDSVSVLSESLPLLHHLNTTVIAATGDAAQHVITLPVRGSTQPGCIVCALPFIRPRDVLTSQAGQSAEDKQRNLQSAIQDTYAQVFAAAQALQAQLQAAHGTRVPIVATGHLTTVGASSNESVREIYVGALEAFPTSAFPPADYIALGHIHKPQKVGGLEHIRYCGSPIALGFDEAKQTKEVLLVDLNVHGLQTITPLATPVCQILASLTGNLASLPAQLQALAAQSSAEHPAWLEVTVQEDDYLPDVAARIDAMVQGLALQVLRVKRQRGTAMPQLFTEYGESLEALTPSDVFARRLVQETISTDVHQALHHRYQEVLASVHAGDAQ
ncbi:exonuclease subunit SbcD [Comamonas jiangduensis]|uniref:exonuclease subunit SbcD n=1 Tax=Comamonas jiangduensis TaxID=1194168 RepID=UPI0028AA53AA|nr:exonuclease subunit SbcD [Comamonas jiangduensis]